MNILYISHLSGASYAGPTYSVPKQIEAQSKVDNVFWYNIIKTSKDEWKKKSYYHDLNDFPSNSINSLPYPFNNPDLVIVEGFYNMTLTKIQKELLFGKYKYIIIPRGELTKLGQKRKFIKKAIANLVVCKRFAKLAKTIQYLTENEFNDSGREWNCNYCIIPNGIDKPNKVKEVFSKNEIKCVSIGRIEPYQKGLDILIDSCKKIKSELLYANVNIVICGPDNEGNMEKLKKLCKEYNLESIITFHDPVYGKEKEELLLNSDIFLMPSRFEGHPMALIEALSYGLPCVVTNGTNMKNEIEKYNAGWTSDNNNEAFSEAMLNMIKDRKNYKIKGTNARLLSNLYLWDEIANNSHNIYCNFINI